MTDRAFKKLAQLVAVGRKARRGRLGAEGLLEGDGREGCRLGHVTRGADVRVGDAVMTTDQQGLLDSELLYGYVSACVLPEQSLYWEIRVRPAAELRRLERVYVVAAKLNPGRVAAGR